MTTASIALLAPISHLPAEGDDRPARETPNRQGPRRLLDFYGHVIADGGLHFHVSPDGITPVDENAAPLQFLEVREGETQP